MSDTLLPLAEPTARELELVRRLGQPIIELPSGGVQCPACDHTANNTQLMGPHFAGHWSELGIPRSQRPTGEDHVKCPECAKVTTRHGLGAHLVTAHAMDKQRANGIARMQGFDLVRFRREGPSSFRETPPTPKPGPKPGPKGPRGNRREDAWGRDCPTCGVEAGQPCVSLKERERITYMHPTRTKGHRSLTNSSPDTPAPRKGSRKQAAEIEVAPPEPDRPRIMSDADVGLAVVMSHVNGSIPSELLPDVVAYIKATEELIEKLRAAHT